MVKSSRNIGAEIVKIVWSKRNAHEQKTEGVSQTGILMIRKRNAMNKKMQLPESKEIYKLTKEIVEPVFGDIKEIAPSQSKY